MIFSILKPGIVLFIFTVVSIFFVVATEQYTKVKIKYNEEELLTKRLSEIVDNYNNPIIEDRFVKKINLHGIEQVVTIYPAKKDNKLFAYLIEHVYPNGYNGDIHLLTGINTDNELLGVRVITHKETPGLGDKIESKKSNWIKQFSGLSLSNPIESNWSVKRDGGSFDQFTGATITPRAVVIAIYQILQYFIVNKIE